MLYPDEQFLTADGFDDAIIGVEERSMRIVYSIGRIIQALISEGLTEEDAYDHFYFNIVGAYVGEQTPIFCNELNF